MMKSPSDAGEVARTNNNMTRLFFEDRSPFVLYHRPPGVGLPDRDQSGSRSGRAVKAFLPRGQLFDLAPRGVSRIARRSAKGPRGGRAFRRIAAFDDVQPGPPGQTVANDRRDAVNASCTNVAGNERNQQRGGCCSLRRLQLGIAW